MGLREHFDDFRMSNSAFFILVHETKPPLIDAKSLRMSLRPEPRSSIADHLQRQGIPCMRRGKLDEVLRCILRMDENIYSDELSLDFSPKKRLLEVREFARTFVG